MIEEYIENKQYKEALALLDTSTEENRLSRLICLYGLEEYQQAKKEAEKAKDQASTTYYDVVAMYISILKELEEYDTAIDLLIAELSMPYIPQQYETVFNTAYDDLLLAKREANEGIQYTALSLEDIEVALQKEQTDEDVLYMIIEQMQTMNIRPLVPVIRQFLRDPNKSNIVKSLLFEVLIEQEIDEEIEIIKGEETYVVNPSYAPMVLLQEIAQEVIGLLQSTLEDENPSLYQLCEQFLSFYLYFAYPRYIDEGLYPALAAAIHYHLATLQYIDIEIEEVEVLYNTNKEDIMDWLSIITSIAF